MSASNPTSPDAAARIDGPPPLPESGSPEDHQHHITTNNSSSNSNIYHERQQSTSSPQPQPHAHPSFPGATVYTPTATPSASLNPRSCVTCRRRKVRCDKHMPCSNCRRAQIPCIFPAPGRAPRRPRPKDPNAPPKQPSSEREIELMKRLRKLEGIVEELSGQIEVETSTRNQSSAGNSPEGNANYEHNITGAGHRVERAESVAGSIHSQASPPVRISSAPIEANFPPPANFNTNPGDLARATGQVNKKFGRLVLNDHGKTRYVSSGFWSKVTDELDALRNETQRLTDEESDVSDDESVIAAANTRSSGDHHAFVLGYRSADVDLRSLHPLPSQIPYMWQVYQENVDPILKILHIPTTTKLIKETRSNLDSLTPANEALMFAIYYAAITSLDENDVRLNFGVEKEKLVTQYRFALEQALAKAEFLVSSDLVVLQALIIFLVLVRRYDDTRFAWTLTGLAIRISQSMGLHRDGSTFPSLTPFEKEMRRRLFWSLCVLDLRSAEDQGTDLSLIDRTFDTQFPLNINDTDITPETTEMPIAREGATDMTFSLIRYEICDLARRLHTMSSASAGTCPRDMASSLEERESMLRDIYEKVEKKYLKNSSCENNPMYWVAANIARVIVAKMTLVIYQPVLFSSPRDEHLSREVRDRIFNAATEIFEYNHQLNSDPRSKQWRWLFQTYTQWHAVAYVLMEVTRRPWSAAVERAWSALNSVFTNPKPVGFEHIAGDAAVWLPLKKIYFKARKHRDAEIERLKADPAAAQQLEMEDRGRAVPKTFAAMPGSVKSAIATERWRKLVNAPKLPPEVEKQLVQQPVPGHNGAQGPSTATDAAFNALAVPGLDSAKAMELVDDMVSQTTPFEPDTFLPLAMSADFGDPTKIPMFGFLAGDPIPRQDNALANLSNNVDNSRIPAVSAPTPMSGPMPTGPHITSTPLVDALKADPHPPPWMWTDGPTFGTNINSTNPGPITTRSPPAQDQGPVRFPIPDLHPDDIDVNMDDDFNWQDWGQSLMESTGGSMGGVWSSHGI